MTKTPNPTPSTDIRNAHEPHAGRDDDSESESSTGDVNETIRPDLDLRDAPDSDDASVDTDIHDVTDEQAVKLIRSNPTVFAQIQFERNLFDYQERFVGSNSKRKAMVCGRQVGKTEICALDGLHHATIHDDATVLITAPSQRQSSELFKRVKGLIGESPMEWGIERSTQTIIELSNGSRIIVVPSGGTGTRGFTADYIIVDEAAFVEDGFFTSTLLPMLATTDGTLALASTPFGKSGFLYDNAWTNRGDEDGWDITHVPTSASPLVSESFIADQKQTLSRTEFRQEILGEFVESASAFFDRDVVSATTTPTADTSQQFRPSKQVVIGADIARHGSDRTVIVPMDENGMIHGEAMVSDSELGLTEATGHIVNLYERFDCASAVIDATGVGAGPVEMLESELGSKAVEGVKFTIDTKQSMYNALKSDLENGEVTLPEHPRLQAEFKDLEYELTRSGKTKIHHPDGGRDDHPDAVVLAAHGRRGAESGYATTSENVVVL